MKYLRYTGEFVSVAGVVYRCEIWQEAESAFPAVGELTFPAEEPLLIEWEETSKEDVICSSAATLQIVSPGDRTYVDLYTITPGDIRLNVYRDDSLYWSGTLDPEFYEEPYERYNNYDVQLVFSDFGCLDRLDYELTGMRTLEEVILYALSQTKIAYTELDFSTYASTTFPDGTPATPETIAIRSDNFADEEGKPSTLLDVLEGVLQPLALRIVQKHGKIYIYDLNGLYAAAEAEPVRWSDTEQTLSVDKVASKVEISFSPYSSGDKLLPEVEYTGEYSPSAVNIWDNYLNDPKYGLYYSFFPNNHEALAYENLDRGNISFTIFLSHDKGKGLSYIDPACYYFHIQQMLGGTEADGVLAGMRMPYHLKQTNGDSSIGYVCPLSSGDSQVLMRSQRAFIPALEESAAKDYLLKLTLEMLLDARYNPFTDEGDGNCGANDDQIKADANWCFIPFSATIYDEDGTALCHYDNKAVTMSAASGYPLVFFGEWKPGKGAYGDAWLVYCNYDDLKEDAGIRGWKTNRHNIGRPGSDNCYNSAYDYFQSPSHPFIVTNSFKQMPDGEFAPYPPQGGWLEIEVYKGARIFKYREDSNPFYKLQTSTGDQYADAFNTMFAWTKDDMTHKFRWYAFKAPQAEIVNHNLIFDTAELDDLSYTGWLNRQAKEEISIDTICGTADDVNPSARGVYCRASDFSQIIELCRAGHQDHPENLLIGTLFSQYSSRHTKLSGEATISASPGPVLYTDRAQSDDMLFIALGESQNCIADTTDITLVELSPDTYEAIIPVDDDE